MNEPVPTENLSEALRVLRITSRNFSQEMEPPFLNSRNLFQNLEEVINGLGLKPSSRPVPRPDYIEQWRELQEGQRQQLESRALRYLCWEPDIATSKRFQNHLERTNIQLTARFLQGLVYSCHARWSQSFAVGSIVEWVRRSLKHYEGVNRILNQWKNSASMILGDQGHEEFAKHLMKNQARIKDSCELWKIEEPSFYVQEAIQYAASYCRDCPELNDYLLTEILPWHSWPLEKFKNEIGAIILSAAEKGSEFVEDLKNFVRSDERLLDPRLPRNANKWSGISEKARLCFIQWLSRGDIEFFFEHVLPRGHDPHGRKEFWLRYVDKVLPRPLLSNEDRDRLQVILWQNKIKVGNFGYIEGPTSAFLLDFGSIIVIEFSRSGNACYIYDREKIGTIVPDFWTSRPFRNLKRQEICIGRIVHRDSWQIEMRALLAYYGIRQEGYR